MRAMRATRYASNTPPFHCMQGSVQYLGHTPSTAGIFRKKFRKDPGNALRAFPGSFLLRVRLGCPKPCNSRHLRLPEHFQNYLPPSTAGGASFFRSGSGEGLPEPVMEFPAVLGVSLNISFTQERFCTATSSHRAFQPWRLDTA